MPAPIAGEMRQSPGEFTHTPRQRGWGHMSQEDILSAGHGCWQARTDSLEVNATAWARSWLCQSCQKVPASQPRRRLILTFTKTKLPTQFCQQEPFDKIGTTNVWLCLCSSSSLMLWTWVHPRCLGVETPANSLGHCYQVSASSHIAQSGSHQQQSQRVGFWAASIPDTELNAEGQDVGSGPGFKIWCP